MTDETKTAAREALAEVLYRMNGRAWYGRDLGEWTSPESRIGRNQHERDRWLRQADAILASPALDAIVAERVAALAEDEALIYDHLLPWCRSHRVDRGGEVGAGIRHTLRALAATLTERTAER